MDDSTRLLSEKYAGRESPAYFDDVDRLKQGEPLAYVIGWIPFLGSRIYLDSHPLIPRTETEFWVEQAFADIARRGFKNNIRILDMFAGSGCIGVAALKHIPDAFVDFGEIEARHLPTIAKNIKENSIDSRRVNTIETDVWSNVTATYDVVFANPPYIAESLTYRVAESVARFEPPSALYAEDDGFALIHETLEVLSKHLMPGGVLYLEHEPEHVSRIATLAHELNMQIVTRKDQFDVHRYSMLTVSPDAPLVA